MIAENIRRISPRQPLVNLVPLAAIADDASSFAGRVRAYLTVPCDIALMDEKEVVSLLPEVGAVADTRCEGAPNGYGRARSVSHVA